MRGPVFTIFGKKWIDTENSLENLAWLDRESKVHPNKCIIWMVEGREKIFSLVIKAKLSGHITRRKESHQIETEENRINKPMHTRAK